MSLPFSCCGTSFSVLILAVTSSPTAPSPRVAPLTSLPCSSRRDIDRPALFGLGGEREGLVGGELEEAADAVDETRHVVFRERVVEREHRHRVTHLGEAPGRRRADLQGET